MLRCGFGRRYFCNSGASVVAEKFDKKGVSLANKLDKNGKPIRIRSTPKDNRPIIQKQRLTNQLHEEKAKELGLPWRIVSSTVLHRYPVVLPDIPEWKAAHNKITDEHEDRCRAWFKQNVGNSGADIIPDENPSYEETLSSLPFTPASRITEADEKNDRRSLERKLAHSLFFVVKRHREDFAWQFPQGKLLEGETARRGGERIIDRSVGDIKRYFISNAPIGHYCYAYPPDLQRQRKQYGAKVFFYRAQYLSGSLKLENRLYQDFAWISRDEVGDYFDKDLAMYMQELLLN